MESGIVVINKESGMTSQNVVSKVKRILNVKKAGHIGTLDPLATGVLPVLVGNSTKMSKYLVEHDKTYVAIIKLGQKSETGDLEGKIVEEKEVNDLTEDMINEVLERFKGKQKQAPHRYSAVKINGKKLYEYAREGLEVEIPTRDIEIYSIKLIKFDNKTKEVEFEVSCSKGTYIRVLCEDIAKALGTVGYMKKLERTEVDNFTIEKAVKLDELTEENIISVEELCEKYQRIDLNKRKLELFLNGVRLTINQNDGVYRVYSEKFIGLGIVKNKLLKRDIVIKHIL